MSRAEKNAITGRCLCGAVQFEIDGRLGPAIYCHCSQCRRASGSAFAANASVRARYLRFRSGRDAIREYESTPGKFRAFCSRCGSPVYSRLASDPETFRIRLGTLDGDPGPAAAGALLGRIEGASGTRSRTSSRSSQATSRRAPTPRARERRARSCAPSARTTSTRSTPSTRRRSAGPARRRSCARCGARRSPTSGSSPSSRSTGAGRVVGHIAFSPVAIEGGSPPALGLGPLAVEPALQRLGIGSALVRAGLERCAELAQIVVVLGHAALLPAFRLPAGVAARPALSQRGVRSLVLRPRARARRARRGSPAGFATPKPSSGCRTWRSVPRCPPCSARSRSPSR